MVPESTSSLASSLVIPATAGTPLSFNPFSFPVFSPLRSAPNLSNYLTQISKALSQIASQVGGGTSLINARATLGILQSQVQADLPQSQTFSSTIANYICDVNTQLNSIATITNRAIFAYYAQNQVAEENLYANAKAAAAALVVPPKPAPAVTVTAYATVTATPDPTVNQVGTSPIIKSGGIIKKSITCVKTVGGKTTTKIVKGFIVSCPPGFAVPKGQSSFSLVKK